MWEVFSEYFSVIESNVSFIYMLIIIYFVTMMIFWYESKNVQKNRNSIFDMWFFSSFIMIIWGRIGFIITFWDEFSQWTWFWLPYERYSETMYVFRAMPWRLLRIWDGGFLFIPMFLAFLIAGYFFTVYVKKWRWRDMFMPVVFSANFFLGITLFVYGLYIDQVDIFRGGGFIIIFTVGVQLILLALRYTYRNNIEAFRKVRQIVVLLFMVIDIWFLSYIFLSQNITQFEKYHVYGFIIFGVFMLVAYLLDVRNPEKGKKTSPEGVPNVSLNQAIKVKGSDK